MKKVANKTILINNVPDKQIELKNYKKNAERNWSHLSDAARIVYRKG